MAGNFSSLIDRPGAQATMPEEVSLALLKEVKNISAAFGVFEEIKMMRAQDRTPILSALPGAEWVEGDTGLIETTAVKWTNRYVNAEEMAVIVPIPQNVLDDSEFDVWGTIQPLLAQAIARRFDQTLFMGVRAPASFPECVLLAAEKVGNKFSRGTAEPAHGGLASDVSELLATMEPQGFEPDYTIAHTTYKGLLRNARNSFGDRFPEIGPEEIYGANVVYPMRGLWPTGKKEAEMFAMESEQFIVGLRQDVSLKLLDQAVIQGEGGAITFNLAQQNMVALRVIFRGGWQVSNQINWDQENEANRYPAAVMLSPA